MSRTFIKLTITENLCEHHLSEGHDLSLLLAAYLLFRSEKGNQKKKLPFCSVNVTKLLPFCKEYLNELDRKFLIGLKTISKDENVNIYQNICNNRFLQEQLQSLLDLGDITVKAMDISSNLVSEIIQTHRSFCKQCGSELVNNCRGDKYHKGSIAVKYDNKKGPSIALHYLHICPNEKCKARYYHSRYHTEGGVYLENHKLSYQMNSKCTFFDDNMVEEANSFLLDDGVGIGSYQKKYNKRFSEEFEEIEMLLQSKGQRLGNRHCSAELCDNRMLDAVMMRRLQIAIETELNTDVFISWNQIKKYKMSQKKCIFNAKQDSEKILTKTVTECSDLFNLMYDKYYAQICKVPMKWLKYVPVKENEILQKHFMIQGDGGQKLTRSICGYPMSLYQEEIYQCSKFEKSDIKNDLCFKWLRCSKSPQKGNKFSKSLTTCIHHTNFLKNKGLKLGQINSFCKYIRIKETLNKIPANRHETKVKKCEQKLKQFKRMERKRFDELFQKLKPMRRSKRDLSATKAKISESIHALNEIERIDELENIYLKHKVDETMMSNPKIAEIIAKERVDENSWDECGGCRNGRHVINHHEDDPLYIKTGGLQNWMTHSGFILSLTENIHLETPTEVLILLFSILTSCAAMKEYTKRIIGIGYDMMCTLYGRLRTLIENNDLSAAQISFFISFLKYMFVDAFHVGGHKNKLCQQTTGLFHPRSKKFNKQRKKMSSQNDSIVEQQWRILNRLHYAKNLCERRFNFTLYDFKKRHNDENWQKLLKQGYTFELLSNMTTLRDYENVNCVLPSTKALIEDKEHQNLKIVEFVKAKSRKRNAETCIAPLLWSVKRMKLS